ncbi:MAG: type III-A CRISPR-associated RAMP protein Csm5 [Nitrospirae bacterium]|nr:type III-A CRISPR-associated RAMP protein Csm5 [Nitrospirota bacterium]
MPIEFDPIEFVKRLSGNQREDFSKRCASESMVEVYKFINSNKALVSGVREVDISKALIDHYSDALRQNRMNKFILNKTAFNPHDNSPYIPGSSLKGAIRTAHLSVLASERQNPIVNFWEISNILSEQDLRNPLFTYKQIGKQRLSNLLEKGLLGIHKSKDPFSDDPFRLVKVSDLLPADDVRTKIIYAVCKSKSDPARQTRADKGDLYQMLEIIQPGSTFEGSITGNNIDKLLSNSHDVYRANRETDLHKSPWLKTNNINIDNPSLIRLGRHGGAEAVTIEGNRYIKIMQKKGEPDKFLDHATTTWLASEEPRPASTTNLLPFGWAVLEVLPFDIKTGIYQERKRTTRMGIEIKDSETQGIASQAAGLKDAVIRQVIPLQKVDPEKDNSLPVRIKKVKNPQTFVDFMKGIKQNEVESLRGISLKEPAINIGLIEYLESTEVSTEIKKIIAKKILEVTTPNKKWDEKKRERYKKLQIMAGVDNV